LIRTEGDPESLASAARGVVRDVDPGLAIFGIEPLQNTVARSVAQQRFTMLLVGAFAAVALVLAAIGIHGVLSYTVAQRTRELGIRLALGAQPGRLVRLVVGQGLRLCGAGLALGLAGALLVTRLLETLLYGVTPLDPGTFFGVPAILLLVALAASYLPARRAARVDPILALRAE
jgi:putative ABC transport system permease protein